MLHRLTDSFALVSKWVLFITLSACVTATAFAHNTLSPHVIVGRVVGENGEPCANAVVVTSAGGQTVTGSDGSFEIACELPPGTSSVQLTAVGSGTSSTLAGSRSVGWTTGSPVVQAGSLVLAQTTSCPAHWLPTFGGAPGADRDVYALAVHDDGNGPALYAGGTFDAVGGVAVNNIARWNGTSWSALGLGVQDDVRALCSFDDGSGPALYAGGSFLSAGGVNANKIAKWNGTSWSACGGGTSGEVLALTVFNDGTGSALYVGGSFDGAGGLTVNQIAKWNGTTWSSLAGGLGNTSGFFTRTANALIVHDAGSGPALYVGGEFQRAGAVLAKNIARWDGSGWTALGTGANGRVQALASHDDGSGRALFAGGFFTNAGGQSASRVAKWNGTAWSAAGAGFTNQVDSLTVCDLGTGPALYAGSYAPILGGGFAVDIARWTGSTWTPLGGGILQNHVWALASYTSGGVTRLYAGGDFVSADGVAALRIVSWNGANWSALGGGGPNHNVNALAVYDDGLGPALYAAGAFTSIGGTPYAYIARWNGTSWSALGSGLNSQAMALHVHDDGSGPALYAGGHFTIAGGVFAPFIARWNGTTWSAVGGGMNDYVTRFSTFDDGSGPDLYAAGEFWIAGGVLVEHIARWDGVSWSALGSGTNGTVRALGVYDDGGGPALYAGGNFGTAGGVSALRIAKWNGATWSALGSGLNSSSVYALCEFDDGSGSALFVGGFFTNAGGVVTNSIAKWNGTAWSAVGGGVNYGPNPGSVYELMPHDDGSGPALFVSGFFATAGSVSANCIAKWNGTSWSALGSGTNYVVNALAAFDDGGCFGPKLFVGGAFWTLNDSHDSYLGRWGCAPSGPGALDCNVNGVLDACDIAAQTSTDHNANGIPDDCEVNGGTPYCFGYTGCPCGNNVPAASNQGCRNSSGLGTRLQGSGLSQVTNDSLVLSLSNLPPTTGTSFVLYVQGTAAIDVPLADGKLCAGGSIVRLAIRPFSGSSVSFPQAGDPALHTIGVVPPAGGARTYQAWHRDTSLPCGTNSNLSNGLSVVWIP